MICRCISFEVLGLNGHPAEIGRGTLGSSAAAILSMCKTSVQRSAGSVKIVNMKPCISYRWYISEMTIKNYIYLRFDQVRGAFRYSLRPNLIL
jgi:hypothetical protein